MSDRRIYRLVHNTARKLAAAACMTMPDGYIVTIQEPNKTRIQEEKYHAMIGDISDRIEFIGRKWDREDWKRILIDDFVRVMRENAVAEGRPDPFADQGNIVPALNGKGFVQLGVQSRKFKVKQASDFIEYLYAYGAENDVVWSEKVRQWDERISA